MCDNCQAERLPLGVSNNACSMENTTGRYPTRKQQMRTKTSVPITEMVEEKINLNCQFSVHTKPPSSKNVRTIVILPHGYI